MDLVLLPGRGKVIAAGPSALQNRIEEESYDNLEIVTK
jgi:hypothetical protein